MIGVAVALIILAAAPGTATAEPGAPGLGITPPYGPPLTTIKLTGTGFCTAPCGPIQLTIASVRVDTATLEWQPDGTFTTFARVPGSARPGEVPVVATQTDKGGQQLAARARFSVTPSLPPPVSFPPPTNTQPPGGLPVPVSNPPPTSTTSGPPPTSTTSVSGEASTSAPAAAPSASQAGESNTGLILGLVAALVVLAAAIGGAIWYRRRRTGDSAD